MISEHCGTCAHSRKSSWHDRACSSLREMRDAWRKISPDTVRVLEPLREKVLLCALDRQYIYQRLICHPCNRYELAAAAAEVLDVYKIAFTRYRQLASANPRSSQSTINKLGCDVRTLNAGRMLLKQGRARTWDACKHYQIDTRKALLDAARRSKQRTHHDQA